MHTALDAALKKQGYDTLTQVQQAVSDPELAERDLLVSAQTGSGKTVGFGLAIAPTLLGEAERFERAEAPLALIITPTRELAMQVRRELTWLYGEAGAQMASCVGGMDMRDERRALERGSHIVVATPGRLRDHIMRGSIDLSAVRAVVLDEADEMLDLGFQEDLEFILSNAPESRRTLMFSATVPRGIAHLAGQYQRDAERITTVAETSQHSDIEYLAMSVSARDTENAIINVLRYYEAPNALVFANTRALVNRLTTRLSNRGFSVVALSGELSQAERTHALQAMRDGRARVCVATDVAARGIDLPGLDLVVHAELPKTHETLLHRSGRTGRAGRKGVSALIVPPAARKKCERLLRSAKLSADWTEAPSAEAVTARDHERLLTDPIWDAPASESEAGVVATLIERFSPDQLAAAFVHLYGARHSAPEELSAPGVSGKPEPRAPFGPSVWFSVSGGKKAGAEPRRLLPILCKAGDLTRDDIGAIRVQYNETFVEIREASVAGFVKALGSAMEIEGKAKVSQLDKAPDLGTPRPAGKPHRAKPSGPRPKPAASRPAPTKSTPSEATSDPKPATPKAASKPKPAAKAKPRAPRPDHPEDSRPKGVVEPYKKREKTIFEKPKSDRSKSDQPRPDKPRTDKPRADAGKPTAHKRKKSMAELAGAPPVGKPGSKKNRARAKALAEAKAKSSARQTRKGPDAPPRRRAPK